MKLRWPGCLSLAAALSVCAAAPHSMAGSPDIWEVAVTPRLARDMAAYRDAQRLFIDAHRGGPDYGGRRQLMSLALRILDRADAVHSPEPRVRFLLGRLLTRVAHDEPAELQREHLERGVTILEETIAEVPEHPDAIDARFALAVAFAKLRKPRKEIEVYDAILERETSRGERALTIMNQAEAYMVAGDLDRAVQGYRSSISISPDHALAHWGLAVALDRSGDPGGAVVEAWAALQYDPNAQALHDDNVFFVPDYDRYWYDALGTMARASHERQPSLSALWWRDAATYWRRYVEAASSDDRWVDAAKSRAKLCERKEKDARGLEVKRPQRWGLRP